MEGIPNELKPPTFSSGDVSGPEESESSESTGSVSPDQARFQQATSGSSMIGSGTRKYPAVNVRKGESFREQLARFKSSRQQTGSTGSLVQPDAPAKQLQTPRNVAREKLEKTLQSGPGSVKSNELASSIVTFGGKRVWANFIRFLMSDEGHEALKQKARDPNVHPSKLLASASTPEEQKAVYRALGKALELVGSSTN